MARRRTVPAAPQRATQLDRKRSWLTRRPEPATAAVPAAAVQLVPSGNGWVLQGGSPAATAAPAARNGDGLSRLLGLASRAAWRYRWQLAPLVAAVLVVAAASADPAAVAAVLAVVAVAGHLAATRLGERVRGRVWLSVRERSMVALYAAAGAGWSAAVAGGWWPATDVAGLAALGVLTGAPAVSWWRSRRIRHEGGKTRGLSARARQLITAWPVTIAATGPAPLRGSAIVRRSVEEPAGDSLTFLLGLAGVHGETAATDDVRRGLEVALGVGVGTVQLEVDRDSACQLRITITPDRHLEHVDAPWPGPVVHPSGDIDFAVTPAGADVRVGLHNDAGVEHMAIVGTSGTGKSNSLVTAVLPGVMERREVVWYADGGLGSSAAHLAGACDWWAVDGVEEWVAMITAAHSVCEARRARRAARGLSAWRGTDEDDPILTLVVDEASLVLAQLPPKVAAMVLELLRVGRKVGVRVVQVTQDPLGSDWIGGRQARGLMAGAGSLIGHRPGDGTAAMLSAGSTSDGVDLRALPPGAGWVGVIRRGQVLATKARVRYARPADVLDRLAGFTPRALAVEDLLAAGAAYRGRVTGTAAAATMRGEPVSPPIPAEPAPHSAENRSYSTIRPSEAPVEPVSAARTAREQLTRAHSGSQRAAAAVAETNRRSVLETLAGFEEGLTAAQIGQECGLPKSTVSRALHRLAEAGQARRDAGGSWHAVAAVVAA